MTDNQYIHEHLNDPSEDLTQSTLIDRFTKEAEEDFSDDVPCIHARVSLDITSGLHTYALPDAVRSIRRITWKGKKLDPLPQRQFREIFQGNSSQGEPFWYIFNNIGLNQIRFYPVPSETIASTTANLYGTEIGNRVIVDYFQMPDFVNAKIPLYFRRRLLKSYILYSCFNVEGEGQNLKNAKYHLTKYNFLKAKYQQLLNDLHNKPRKLVIGTGGGANNYFPASPVLPVSRFGVSVDTGE